VTWTIPVDISTAARQRSRALGRAELYENQPFPFRWATAFDAIISKRFSPGFTLALRHSDYHTVMMGTTGVNGLAPFATFLSPNAIHVASFDVLGTFHVDTTPGSIRSTESKTPGDFGSRAFFFYTDRTRQGARRSGGAFRSKSGPMGTIRVGLISSWVM